MNTKGKKGLTKINYDDLGHPIRIQFRNGHVIKYVYAADGRKLREKHITAVDGLTVQMGNTLELTPAQTMAVDSMDYAGNLRFHKQRVSSSHVLFNLDYHFDGGYLSVTPSTSLTSYNRTLHFFIRDHQGNNRLVVDGSDNIKQINHYYPYGCPYGDTSTNQGLQPYKYNGKELDRVHGLDWYDYGARRYDPAYCMFSQMDPLCEQYPHLNPYVYCAGNPVNYVDPDGREIWIMQGKTAYQYQDGNIYKDGQIIERKKKFINNVVSALAEIQKSETGKSLIKTLQNSTNVFKIKKGNNSFTRNKDRGAYINNSEIRFAQGLLEMSDGAGGVINWNPKDNHGGYDETGKTFRPAFIGLAHELMHAKDANEGVLFLDEPYENPITGLKYVPDYKGIPKTEWRASYGENLIRKELGLPLRKYYNTGDDWGPELISPLGIPLNYP